MSSQSVLGFCGKIYPYSFTKSHSAPNTCTHCAKLCGDQRGLCFSATLRAGGRHGASGAAGRLPAADSPAWLAPSPPRLQTHLSTLAALGHLPLAITQRGPKSESRRGPSLLPGLSVQPLRPEPWSRPRFLPSPSAPGRSVHTRARTLLLRIDP